MFDQVSSTTWSTWRSAHLLPRCYGADDEVVDSQSTCSVPPQKHDRLGVFILPLRSKAQWERPASSVFAETDDSSFHVRAMIERINSEMFKQAGKLPRRPSPASSRWPWKTARPDASYEPRSWYRVHTLSPETGTAFRPNSSVGSASGSSQVDHRGEQGRPYGVAALAGHGREVFFRPEPNAAPGVPHREPAGAAERTAHIVRQHRLGQKLTRRLINAGSRAQSLHA